MSPKVTESHRQQKKLEILDAAKKVFIRKGYEQTTMKDIVDESGLSRGGVYLYYSSTEEIFLDIMKLNDRHLITMVQNRLKHCSVVWEAILELAEQIKKVLFSVQNGIEPVIFEYFMACRRNEKAQNLLDERFAGAMECLSGLMNAGIERKEFKPVFAAADIAVYLLSFLDGLEINIIQHGTEKFNPDSIINQVLQYLRYVLNPVGDIFPNRHPPK